MPQRLSSAFNKKQPLYCLQEAGLKGKEPRRTSDRARETCSPWADPNRHVRREGKPALPSTSVSISVYARRSLIISRWKIKEKKKRACQYQPAQTGAQPSKGWLCPRLMTAISRDRCFALQPSSWSSFSTCV